MSFALRQRYFLSLLSSLQQVISCLLCFSSSLLFDTVLGAYATIRDSLYFLQNIVATRNEEIERLFTTALWGKAALYAERQQEVASLGPVVPAAAVPGVPVAPSSTYRLANLLCGFHCSEELLSIELRAVPIPVKKFVANATWCKSAVGGMPDSIPLVHGEQKLIAPEPYFVEIGGNQNFVDAILSLQAADGSQVLLLLDAKFGNPTDRTKGTLAAPRVHKAMKNARAVQEAHPTTRVVLVIINTQRAPSVLKWLREGADVPFAAATKEEFDDEAPEEADMSEGEMSGGKKRKEQQKEKKQENKKRRAPKSASGPKHWAVVSEDVGSLTWALSPVLLAALSVHQQVPSSLLQQ